MRSISLTMVAACSALAARTMPFVSSLVLLIISFPTGWACTPESFFLFRSEARGRLDSLNADPVDHDVLERFVLMHNLAFHKDKAQREAAEKLLGEEYPERERNPLIKAYAGSLQMIKVSHRSAGSKVIRTLNPFAKSPYTEAREGYWQISGAVSEDPTNPVLRILRATAAAESAEHLQELFDSAAIDLTWLQANQDATDSVGQFLIHLNHAKLHFKIAKRDKSRPEWSEAMAQVMMALSYACTPVYRQWAEEWGSKIRALEEQVTSR